TPGGWACWRRRCSAVRSRCPKRASSTRSPSVIGRLPPISSPTSGSLWLALLRNRKPQGEGLVSRTKFKESDPKPSVDRVQELASRIIQGDILLPKFQRSFVWDRQQILDLLDSIAKNYPIGSALFWLSRQRLASERTIADLPIKERPPEYPV